MTEGALDRIERRLKDEKYMGDDDVEMVMAVVEEEIEGDTDREAIDWHVVNNHRLHKPARDE